MDVLLIVPAFIAAVVATNEEAVVTPEFETVNLSVPPFTSTLKISTDCPFEPVTLSVISSVVSPVIVAPAFTIN